ncbi:MAG: cupin domain-containing protein [Carbonactinosporaceae bacterium]
MKIVKGRARDATSERRSATFTGEVWADPVSAADGVNVLSVLFLPSSRTHWHAHERGQVLHVTAGRGLVCRDGEAPQEIGVGDTVWVPPGERHWHGASSSGYLVHLAVSLGETEWLGPVSDQDHAG